MNRAHLHVTLRELRASFGRPKTLAVLAGIAIVLGLSGPFDTINAFQLLPRMAYWAAVVPLTYAAGLVGSNLIAPLFARRPSWARLAGRAFGAALMVCAALMALNTVLGLRFDARALGLGFASVYVICLVIEVLAAIIHGNDEPKTPALLARLPLDRRGPLVALVAQDHYIQVITRKGRAMILMRLSDAIAECTPTLGVQIHRSYWAALDQIDSVRRTGDAAVVTLKTGEELPVARTRLKAMIKAGLLPRGGK